MLSGVCMEDLPLRNAGSPSKASNATGLSGASTAAASPGKTVKAGGIPSRIGLLVFIVMITTIFTVFLLSLSLGYIRIVISIHNKVIAVSLLLL